MNFTISLTELEVIGIALIIGASIAIKAIAGKHHHCEIEE